jgi:hypothetical protein
VTDKSVDSFLFAHGLPDAKGSAQHRSEAEPEEVETLTVSMPAFIVGTGTGAATNTTAHSPNLFL